jgi:hypothetical protein
VRSTFHVSPMNHATILTVIPQGALQQQLTHLEAKLSTSDQYDPNWTAWGPLRRTPALLQASLGGTSAIKFRSTFRAADELVGPNAISEPLLGVPLTCHLEMIKAGLRARYPAVDSDLIDTLSLEDCQIDQLEVRFSWVLLTAADAAQMYLDLLRHCVVCLDAIEVDVNRNHGGQRKRNQRPRVSLDGDQRWVFHARLPWGRAQVQLARDHSPSLSQLPDEASKSQLRAEVARVFQICIKANPETFTCSRTGRKLPRLASELATRSDSHPAQLILDQLKWELWLDIGLATHADQLVVDRSDDAAAHIVTSHLNGEDVRLISPLHDPKEFARYRDKLIEKLNLDLAVPFSIAQHNLASELGPQLTWEGSFNAADHPLLQAVSLSSGNALASLDGFRSALAGTVVEE